MSAAIVDIEAQSCIEGLDVTRLAGASLAGPDRADFEGAAFKAYQDAFHFNAARPDLHNAVALVKAWNNFALVMGVDLLAQLGDTR